MYYKNPVITGFHPDPSICRVGEDYYLVNSTFQYFPSIIISHSKDLVHWEIIGHAITKSEYLDLSQISDSHGIWAPDISYHKGIFYIFATLRLNTPIKNDSKEIIRRQVVVKAERPEGPYSKPVFLDIDGIDPSHFVDEDGSHYMVLNPGVSLVKLNDDCTEALSVQVQVWSGITGKSPEGPHIFKKDGYYYAILAEGGTGYTHCVTVARSKYLYGPYDECLYNPVLTQKNPDAVIHRAGHGKLVETQNGEWWMVYLCGRPIGGRFCTLGRETSLDPIQWTDDGWFVVNNRQGPSEVQTAPLLKEKIYYEKYWDDFELVKLDLNWQFVRNPVSQNWSLDERPGYLRIYGEDAEMDSIHAKNIIVRREKHHYYTARVKMEFSPVCEREEAGMTCYYSTNSYIKFFLTFQKGLQLKLIENRGGLFSEIACVKDILKGVLYLKVVVKRELRSFYYSYDNLSWIMAGLIHDTLFLSDEGVEEIKRFTGTMLGMYSWNGGSGRRTAADFDWFSYTPVEAE